MLDPLAHARARPETSPPDDRLNPSISVLIVVDVCLYREGIAHALTQAPGLRVVGSFADIEQAGIAIRELAPDIVLLDPGTDPDFLLVESIGKGESPTRVVALGVREEERDVLRCAEAGAAAYVPRDASIGDLIAAVERAARGEVLCPPRIAASLFRRLALLADQRPESALAVLTPREQEIVGLIDEGLSNKQIAQRLEIGLSTVKNHVHNLLHKLNASRRSVAAARTRRSRALRVANAAATGRS